MVVGATALLIQEDGVTLEIRTITSRLTKAVATVVKRYNLVSPSRKYTLIYEYFPAIF